MPHILRAATLLALFCAPLFAAIPSGYVSYWKMDGSLNDEAGLNNGTIQGGTAAYADGINGRAIQLNSSSLYVDVGTGPSLDFSGSFSIGGWLYFTGGGAYAKFVDKSNWAGGFYIQAGDVWPGYWDFHFQSREGAIDTLPLSNQLNSWVHLMGVYDGAVMSLYRNGQLVDTTASAGMVAATTISLKFGKIDGLFDEMIYYNRALTANEVTELMATTRDTTPPVISAIHADTLPVYRALVTWKTDIIATAQVEYGIDTSYFSQLYSQLDTLHAVRIYGLTEGTRYPYRVRSKNSQGYESVSPWCTVAVSAQDPRQKRMLTSHAPFAVTDRVWPANPGDAAVCLWADDKLAAVSIGVDDNIQPDHAWWMQMGQKYGFRFTWWVVTGNPESEGQPGFNSFFGTWNDFRTLHAAGHEIASHSLTHNCSMTNFDEELSHSKAQIEAAIPGYLAKTYAGPCGNTPPAEITSKYYIAHRGVNGGTNPANGTNYNGTAVNGDFSAACLLTPGNNSWPCSYRGWQVIFYHYLQGTNDTIENKVLKPLYDNRGNIWEGTFAEVAAYGQERDTRVLTVNIVTDSSIAFTLADSMLDTLFNYPLTVKVRLDNSWPACDARQNNTVIPCSLTIHNGNLYALVKAVPDRGEVRLTKGATTGVTMKKLTGLKVPDTWIRASVFDLQGQCRGTVRFNAQGLVATDVVRGLPAGIYLLKTDGAASFQKRLIVR